MHIEIGDDADMATVIKAIVAALNQADLQIGKADRDISNEQIKLVEDAIGRMRKTLDFKKRLISRI